MPAIVRIRVVPGVFLWLVLCIPGSPVTVATVDVTRDGSVSVVISAPVYPAPQLVRVKADRTTLFSSGCLPAPRSTWLHRPAESTTPETTLTADPPSVVLTCPPLAPRPPPAV